ncbi:unnamed protein product [Boreogadus saida]
MKEPESLRENMKEPENLRENMKEPENLREKNMKEPESLRENMKEPENLRENMKEPENLKAKNMKEPEMTSDSETTQGVCVNSVLRDDMGGRGARVCAVAGEYAGWTWERGDRGHCSEEHEELA